MAALYNTQTSTRFHNSSTFKEKIKIPDSFTEIFIQKDINI